MRLMIRGVLAVGVAAGACNRADAVGMAPVAAASSENLSKSAAVATTGSTEAAAPVSAAARDIATREVTIPAGTRLSIVLDTGVGSDTSRVEEPVHAHLARAVNIRGLAVLGEGTRVSGVVTDATRSAKVKGRAHVAVRFDTLTPSGDDERYRIQTVPVGRVAAGTKKKDALEIAGPAGGGALIGALLGGTNGALIGTAVGAGAGTAVVLSTRGQEVHLPKGAALTLKLSAPLTIRVRG